MQAPDTAAFRAVLDSVFASPAYRWAESPGLVTAIRKWWHRFGEWLQAFQGVNPQLFRLILIGLLIVLLAIFAHAVYLTYRAVRIAVADPERAASKSAVVVRDAAWYRREADRAAGEGRLLDALQLAFAALALTLDAEGVLRYQASMTPAECAAAARLGETDRMRLRQLVGALYAHVFGGRPCGIDDYERWRALSARPWHAAPY